MITLLNESLASVMAALTPSHLPYSGAWRGVDERALSFLRDGRAYYGATAIPWTVDSPAEGWERLATIGIVSTGTPDDARRSFVCGTCDGIGLALTRGVRRAQCLACGDPRGDLREPGSGCVLSPARILDVVSLGARWRDVLAVEELAFDACERALPWGGRRCDRVVWRVASAESSDDVVLPRRGWPTETIPRTMWASDAYQTAWLERRDAFMARYPRADKEAIARGAHGRAVGEALAAGTVAAWNDPRPCPYVPLLAMYDLGFALDGIVGGAATLVCPPAVPL